MKSSSTFDGLASASLPSASLALASVPLVNLAHLSGARPLRPRAARWRLPGLQAGLAVLERAVAFAASWASSLLIAERWDVIPFEATVLASLAVAFTLFRSGRVSGPARMAPVQLAGWVLRSVCVGSGLLLVLHVPAGTAAAWAGGTFALAGAALLLLRAGFCRLVALMLADGRLANHVAVIGDGPAARRTIRRLLASDPHYIHVVGRYDLAPEPMAGVMLSRGNLRVLLTDCRLGMVDTVIVAMEPGDRDGFALVQEQLRPCVQDIYLSAELMEVVPDTARVFAFGTTPVMLVGEAPLKGWAAWSKMLLDRAGAAVLLLVASPLLLMIAIAIRLESPGPLMFRQLRVGYNNQLFHVFKFRSMFDGAADRQAKQQTVAGDKRVTRVGRVIRRLSLDELPQLLNVLRGEMSLVGPRPHAPGTSVSGQRIHSLVDNYASRHVVRPGITGLAQMRGLRGGLETRQQVEDRLASDLEYIRSWSIWLDLKIMVGTLLLELRARRGC